MDRPHEAVEEHGLLLGLGHLEELRGKDDVTVLRPAPHQGLESDGPFLGQSVDRLENALDPDSFPSDKGTAVAKGNMGENLIESDGNHCGGPFLESSSLQGKSMVQ